MVCEVLYTLWVLGQPTPLPALTLHLECNEALAMANIVEVRPHVFVDAFVHPEPEPDESGALTHVPQEWPWPGRK
jgi:hypothetical protein